MDCLNIMIHAPLERTKFQEQVRALTWKGAVCVYVCFLPLGALHIF